MCHNHSGQSYMLYGCLQKDLWVKLQKRSPFCQLCFSKYTRLQQYNGNMTTLDKLYNIVPQGNLIWTPGLYQITDKNIFFIINTKQTINHTYIYLHKNKTKYNYKSQMMMQTKQAKEPAECCLFFSTPGSEFGTDFRNSLALLFFLGFFQAFVWLFCNLDIQRSHYDNFLWDQ